MVKNCVLAFWFNHNWLRSICMMSVLYSLIFNVIRLFSSTEYYPFGVCVNVFFFSVKFYLCFPFSHLLIIIFNKYVYTFESLDETFKFFL